MTITKFGKHLNILKYIRNNVPLELEIHKPYIYQILSEFLFCREKKKVVFYE